MNDDNATESTTTTTTVNNSGVVLPTNATELVDGLYVYQDGEGNSLTYDSQTGETRPMAVLVQGGTGNVLTVYLATPPQPDPAEQE
jgi:hypothetical protein